MQPGAGSMTGKGDFSHESRPRFNRQMMDLPLPEAGEGGTSLQTEPQDLRDDERHSSVHARTAATPGKVSSTPPNTPVRPVFRTRSRPVPQDRHGNFPVMSCH